MPGGFAVLTGMMLGTDFKTRRVGNLIVGGVSRKKYYLSKLFRQIMLHIGQYLLHFRQKKRIVALSSLVLHYKKGVNAGPQADKAGSWEPKIRRGKL